MAVSSKILAVITAITCLFSGASGKEQGLEQLGEIIDRTEQTADNDSGEISSTLDTVELCGKITIGWNLGNTLDATNGSGLSTETSWGNPKATEELILAVKEAGFNAVRIPTTWYTHCDENYNIDLQWLDRVQTVVDYAYNNDMYVILNLHHENWHFTSYDNEREAKRILAKLWKQIAARFADYDEHLIFEAMNEPRKVGTAYEWGAGDEEGRKVVNSLNAHFVKTVRATGGNNRYRALMIPTYAASASGLDWIELPADDHLIVSIHAYTPYNFAMNTGQWATSKFSEDDAESVKELNWLSAKLNELFVSKGIGVIIGECGATDKGNLEDRLRWAKFFPDVFGQYGIPVFLWDNGSFGTGGEKYGLINRTTLKWAYPDYIKTLVESAENA